MQWKRFNNAFSSYAERFNGIGKEIHNRSQGIRFGKAIRYFPKRRWVFSKVLNVSVLVGELSKVHICHMF